MLIPGDSTFFYLQVRVQRGIELRLKVRVRIRGVEIEFKVRGFFLLRIMVNNGGKARGWVLGLGVRFTIMD